LTSLDASFTDMLSIVSPTLYPFDSKLFGFDVTSLPYMQRHGPPAFAAYSQPLRPSSISPFQRSLVSTTALLRFIHSARQGLSNPMRIFVAMLVLFLTALASSAAINETGSSKMNPRIDRHGSCAHHCGPQPLCSAFQDPHDRWRVPNSDHIRDQLFNFHTTSDFGAAVDHASSHE
jgi:hypothetical protein